MAQVFYMILSLSVSGGLIGLLILLIRPVTKRLFAKKWAYYLWLLVLVRLMVPIHVDVNVMERLSTRLSEVLERQENVEDRMQSERLYETDEEEGVGAVGETTQAAEVGSAEEKIRETEAGSAEEKIYEPGAGSAGEMPGGIDDKTRIFYIAGIIWFLGGRLWQYGNYIPTGGL